MSFGQFQRFRLIMPNTLLAFPETDVTCLDHFKSSFNITPRYEIDSASSSSTPQKTYFLCGGTFLVEIQMVLHLEGLNAICYLLCHASSCRKSSCSWSSSSSFEMTPYNNASSAKSLIEDFKLSVRSFT